MLIALHKGKGFIAKAIQWQTRSPYSHASVVFPSAAPDGTTFAIEAREFRGVRKIEFGLEAEHEEIDLFRVEIKWAQYNSARQFLFEQLGKPYDYTMVARFISRRQLARETSGKWFCSELVYYAFMQAGINLLDRIEPWAVSPGLLALSPLLIPVNQQDGWLRTASPTNDLRDGGAVEATGMSPKQGSDNASLPHPFNPHLANGEPE
jgi:hypothetical protein